jgi:hypothetical protein
MPNGVDLETTEAARAKADAEPPSAFPKRAVFAGSAVHHNHEAVRMLLDRVAPALENEVEFVIVGGCARRFRRHRRSNVLLDPDGEVAHYAGRHSVGVNAVEKGSGTSMKLLYYLAHGLPVLTTPFGLRGFEELSPWVTTANLSEFPQALRRDLPPPDGVREKLERYQWRQVAADALRTYEALADGRPRR